jgi:hypothetical protein
VHCEAFPTWFASMWVCHSWANVHSIHAEQNEVDIVHDQASGVKTITKGLQ